ncbi:MULTISPECIES: class F sortase [Streptomyces]|nr:class F sortase [Streptomyces xanthii]
MPDAHRSRGSRLRRAGEGLVVSLVAAGAFAFTVADAQSGPPQPGAGARAVASGRAVAPMPAARPLRVVIPELHVDAPLTKLRLQDDGRLAAPPEDDDNLAGWWADGPVPGTRGTAIVAGHVDIPDGPAVFYGLGALKPGTTVDITRSDHRTARFTVDSVDVYASDDFPDRKVYGDTGRPELRLITCGGGYDEERGRYKGNVVVTAHLSS